MRFRSILVVATGAVVLATSGFFFNTRAAHAGPSQAPQSVIVSNLPQQAVPVIPQGTTIVTQAIPPTQFSVLDETGVFEDKVLSGPDPSGTRYAITSVVVANAGGTEMSVQLDMAAGTTSDCKTFSGATSTLGPYVTGGPGQTASVSFAQPFVFAALPGANTCLILVNPGLTVTVVGYRI